MNTENDQYIKEIVSAIRRIYRAVYIDAAKVGRSYGLTASQSGVLRTLGKYESLSSSELSRRLFMTPSNMTGIIDRLEKKGMVERIKKEGDRRVVLITLTEAGEDLSRSLPDPIEQRLSSGLADLNTKKIKSLNQSMTEILDLINADNIVDAPIDFSPINEPPDKVE